MIKQRPAVGHAGASAVRGHGHRRAPVQGGHGLRHRLDQAPLRPAQNVSSLLSLFCVCCGLYCGVVSWLRLSAPRVIHAVSTVYSHRISGAHSRSSPLSPYHGNRGIVDRIPSVVLNGDPDRRYIGNLNFSFAYVEGESLLMVSCWLHVRCCRAPFQKSVTAERGVCFLYV